MTEDSTHLSVGQCATLACLLEVNAPKPGNVHRAADFDDATLNDFAASAVAIGPQMQAATSTALGETVLRCVQATQSVAATNTNLGTILLIAPLASVPRSVELARGIGDVLGNLTPDDAANVYEAIRLARPRGLGESLAMDVHYSPPDSLVDAMKLSAARDAVAAEYATGFTDTLEKVAPLIVSARAEGLTLPNAIVHVQIQLLAEFGDTLIARKCGDQINQRCQGYAERILEAGSPHDENYHRALADFDFWLRSDGRQRNPGATADLLAAGLFVCLRDDLIAPPYG